MKLSVSSVYCKIHERDLKTEAIASRIPRILLLAACLAGGFVVSGAALSQTPDSPTTGRPISEPSQPLDLDDATDVAQTDTAHIYIAAADGSNITLLTQGRRPSWSPDSQKIAFHRVPQEAMSRRARARAGQIYTINFDGTGERSLGPGINPSWSPDGVRIAFASDEGIVLIAADGSGMQTLFFPDFGDNPMADMEFLGVGKPAWSPDGSRIAFAYTVDFLEMGPFTQTYVMNDDGSDARRLSSTSGRQYTESDPAWSPDGSRFVFGSYGFGLALVDAIGAPPRPLLRGFPYVTFFRANPEWSPDGNLIAFRASSTEGPAIWVVDRDGDSPSMLIPLALDPAWSPDGAKIAFVSEDPPAITPSDFPPVSRPAWIYDRQDPHTIPLDALSRYVLFEDGSFELQYLIPDWDLLTYSGTFSISDASVWFDFDADPRWGATGSFYDDTLLVQYNSEMMLSDFEHGTYLLTTNPSNQGPGGPIKNPDGPAEPEPPDWIP